MNPAHVTLQFVDQQGRALDPKFPLLYPFTEGVPIPAIGEVIEFPSGLWKVQSRRFHYRHTPEKIDEVDVCIVCNPVTDDPQPPSPQNSPPDGSR